MTNTPTPPTAAEIAEIAQRHERTERGYAKASERGEKPRRTRLQKDRATLLTAYHAQADRIAELEAAPKLVREILTVSGPFTDADIKAWEEACKNAPPMDIQALDERVRAPEAAQGKPFGVSLEILVDVIADAWARETAMERSIEETLDRRRVLRGRFKSSGEALAIAKAVATFAQPVALTEDERKTDTKARKLYVDYCDNQGIHSNRFPAWSELSETARAEWREKVTS